MNRALALMMTAALVSTGVAMAQPKPAEPAPAKPLAQPQPSAGETKPIQFTDQEMSQVAAAITGSWICTNVPHAGGAGAADLVLSVAPVASKDMTDLLYAEVARADALNRPHRQALWQLHRVQGKLRLKTMEFRRTRGELLSAAGLWAAPDAFPSLGSEDFVTTLDIELSKTKDGKGWTGRTLHSYPTSMGGAVEMTSQVTISPETFTTADQGFDADGKVVWGPDDKNAQGYTFKKHDAGVKVERLDGGVVVVDFPAQAAGNPAQNGDKIMVQYSGYLANGWMFDSSFERGTPLTYVAGSKFIEGWKKAMMGAKKGMQRKIVIPGPQGFGDSGELRGKVPANATLYIDCQIVDVVPGGAVGMAPAPMPGANPVGPTMQPLDPNSPEAKAIQEKIRRQQEAKKAELGSTSPTAPKP
jgi:FKBP-type peptidyl-prolyl cis-trans isomerase/CpeT/CpcT family (DUF1001)